MRKKLFISLIGILALTLLSGIFINAYSEGGNVYGKCDPGVYPCTAHCPHCNEAFYPIPDRNGEGSLTRGQCPSCGQTVQQESTSTIRP